MDRNKLPIDDKYRQYVGQGEEMPVDEFPELEKFRKEKYGDTDETVKKSFENWL